MPPLVIAGVTAAATIGGAAISASASKKAAKSAANTATANAASNNALARENRDFGFNVLSPYSRAGLQAQNVLGGMLYGTSQPSALQGTQQYGPPQGQWDGYLQANPDVASEYATKVDKTQFSTPQEYAEWHYQNYGRNEGRVVSSMQPNALEQAVPGGASAPGQSAWDQFRNSTNYQFRYDEGMKGLNLGLANNGYAGSGMAVKEAIKYGQNFASNEVNNYMNILQGQQNIGMGAASAMVGVGNNATNNVMANNASAASTSANAALMRGQAQGQMWGSIAQGVGQVAGAVGSSYAARAPTTPAPYMGVAPQGGWFG